MTSTASSSTEPAIPVLISAEAIQTRIRELASAISGDYAGRDLVLIGVLRGVVFFMADLMRAISIPTSFDMISISRYGPTTQTRGVVRITKDLEEPIEGRDVLFVEDIIDTGLTLGYLLRTLRARGPASLEVCVLLDRPHRRLIDIPVAYRGFEIRDDFVVGYGLDYRQHHRNLPYIGLFSPSSR